MSDWYILNDDKTITKASNFIEGAEWYESNRDKRRVAETYVGDTRISTVFLSLDQRMFEDVGQPLVFETMVFGGPLDQEQYRYSTFEQAEAGHALMVERVKVAQ